MRSFWHALKGGFISTLYTIYMTSVHCLHRLVVIILVRSLQQPSTHINHENPSIYMHFAEFKLVIFIRFDKPKQGKVSIVNQLHRFGWKLFSRFKDFFNVYFKIFGFNITANCLYFSAMLLKHSNACPSNISVSVTCRLQTAQEKICFVNKNTLMHIYNFTEVATGRQPRQLLRKVVLLMLALCCLAFLSMVCTVNLLNLSC